MWVCGFSTCRMSESCHTYKRVTSHPSTSRMSESCHTYKRVKSHPSTSRMSESCHTYKRVKSHPSTCRMIESCHTYKRVTSHPSPCRMCWCIKHGASICATRPNHTCECVTSLRVVCLSVMLLMHISGVVWHGCDSWVSRDWISHTEWPRLIGCL